MSNKFKKGDRVIIIDKSKGWISYEDITAIFIPDEHGIIKGYIESMLGGCSVRITNKKHNNITNEKHRPVKNFQFHENDLIHGLHKDFITEEEFRV